MNNQNLGYCQTNKRSWRIIWLSPMEGLLSLLTGRIFPSVFPFPIDFLFPRGWFWGPGGSKIGLFPSRFGGFPFPEGFGFRCFAFPLKFVECCTKRKATATTSPSTTANTTSSNNNKKNKKKSKKLWKTHWGGVAPVMLWHSVVEIAYIQCSWKAVDRDP